jgi:ribonuclease HI
MPQRAEAKRPIIVFTDGAAKGNPGPGGWGAVIVDVDDRVRELGGGAAHATNNRMELTAPIEALRRLQTISGPVALYTDSTYLIRGIRDWIWAWRRRGWKTAEGNDVLNRELWERLSQLVEQRGRKGIEWHYVRGHIGTPGNERADEIANAFALGEDPGLYDGPLGGYPWKILEIPPDTALPQSSSAAGRGGAAKSAAYSYLSMVDGVAMRHATWPECERRVKGRSGARFKKATSAENEAAILRAWGVDPDSI